MTEMPEIVQSLETQCAYERKRYDLLLLNGSDPETHRRQSKRLSAAEDALAAARKYAACFGDN